MSAGWSWDKCLGVSGLFVGSEFSALSYTPAGIVYDASRVTSVWVPAGDQTTTERGFYSNEKGTGILFPWTGITGEEYAEGMQEI